MHVLTQTQTRFRVVLHIAIPAGNNLAGVPWRTAVVRSGLGGKTILPDGDGTAGTISAAEKTNIVTDGSVFEEVIEWDVTRNGTLSGAAILTYMNELYALRSAEVLSGVNGLQMQLTQFGRTL